MSSLPERDMAEIETGRQQKPRMHKDRDTGTMDDHDHPEGY